MIITTTDPITGEELSNLEVRHFLIEGEGHLAGKIYTESEETRRRCLDIGIEHPAGIFAIHSIIRTPMQRTITSCTPGHTIHVSN